MIIFDIVYGLIAVSIIWVIGFSVSTAFMSNSELHTVTFSKWMILSISVGVSYIGISQLLSFFLFGKIYIFICFIPLLLVVLKRKLIKNIFSITVDKKILFKFKQLFNNNKLSVTIFTLFLIYLVFRILFFPPFASDDLWNWHQIAKIIYHSDKILYPSENGLVSYRIINNNQIFTYVDTHRAYPIMVPLVYNFIHHICFGFNLLATKSFYLLSIVLCLFVFYEIMISFNYKTHSIIFSLLLLISTPYFFIFSSSGYNDGILGIYLLVATWGIMNYYKFPVLKNLLFFIIFIPLMIKLEGLYVIAISTLGLILYFNRINKIKYIINLMISLLLYLTWVYHVYETTGQLYKPHYNLVSFHNLVSIFSFDFIHFLLRNYYFLHYPFVTILLILSIFYYIQYRMFNIPEVNFILLPIIFYLIPWYISHHVSGTGPGTRSVSQILPLIILFSTFAINRITIFYSNSKFFNKISYFFMILIPLSSFIIIGSAPYTIYTQFPNLVIYDDVHALKNIHSNSEKAYGSVHHGLMEASYLASKWADRNLPSNSKIALNDTESGVFLFINNLDVNFQPISKSFRSIDKLIHLFKEEKFTHIIYDAYYQMPESSYLPYLLATPYFKLLKSFKYNPSAGYYKSKPLYATIYEIDYSAYNYFEINELNKLMPLPSPIKQVVPQYSVTYTFDGDIDYNYSLVNSLNHEENLFNTNSNIIISLNSKLLSTSNRPVTISHEMLENTKNILSIVVENVEGIYSIPALQRVSVDF